MPASLRVITNCDRRSQVTLPVVQTEVECHSASVTQPQSGRDSQAAIVTLKCLSACVFRHSRPGGFTLSLTVDLMGGFFQRVAGIALFSVKQAAGSGAVCIVAMSLVWEFRCVT